MVRVFITSLMVLGLILGGSNLALGYAVDQSETKNISNNTSRLIEWVFRSFSQEGTQEIVNRGALVDIPTTSTASGSFSSSDLLTALKAIITLVLNLFFIVIEVVIQILQALLGTVISYHPPA